MGNECVHEVGRRDYNLEEVVYIGKCVGCMKVLPAVDTVFSVVSSPIGFAAANETNKQ